MIDRELLEQMFADIRATGAWDLDGPLLWGYFFTDGDPDSLARAAEHLVTQGYRYVDIFPNEKQEPSDPDLWWLHVERVERHSVDSLDRRNAELYAFAERHALGSYDGMDVGPVNAL